MNSITIVSILFISVFVSGIAVLFIKRDSSTFLKLILSFSGAYLFGLTVLHLLPHVYHGAGQNMSTIGLYILGGFLFQLFLEYFSQGVEHGHIHTDNAKLTAFPYAILISLCLHGFLEGMPLAGQKQGQLVFGIALHHIPAAFALASLLIAAGVSKTKLLLCIAGFALATPLGYLTSMEISENAVGDMAPYYNKMMAVVVGIFLHVSTTILFESGSPDHHIFNRKKIIAVVVGILLSLTGLLFGDHDHGHHHDHNHQDIHMH
ncbi:MAG: ZIP family metal transporter [Sphingobacterium sp.]